MGVRHNTHHKLQEEEESASDHGTSRLTTRGKQTNRGTGRGGSTESGTSQRKRTSLTATKKTATPDTSAFMSARISPQNSAKSSKHKRAVTGQTAFTADSPAATASKSTSGRLLLWQQLDLEHVAHNKAKIKSGRQNFLVPGRMRGLHKEVSDGIDVKDPTHLRANISPNLRLVVNGIEQGGSDSDETAQRQPLQSGVHAYMQEGNEHGDRLDLQMESPPLGPEMVETEEEVEDPAPPFDQESPRLPSPAESRTVSVIGKRKAARKLYSFYASDSESSHEVQDSDADVLAVEHPANQASPGRTSKTPSVHGSDLTSTDKSISSLKAALGSYALPSLRMQATKQLPFLKRNLTAGFLARCQLARVPIYSDNRPFVLKFHYEHIDGIFYETKVDDISCPLCKVFGAFRTREMLQCHLSWDHPEILHEWHIEEDQNLTSWKLKVLIPERIDQEATEANIRVVTEDPQDPQISEPTTPITNSGRRAYDLSILPRVALSPAQSPEPLLSSDSARGVSQADTQLPEKKEEFYESSATLSLSRTAPSPHPSLVAGTLLDKHVTYNQEQLPPPNPKNPLGPAACPPYLPAESVYGGPAVLYSCRPGGPCLYDLLGTLPLEPYGLLSWEVIDREEEIYESDDIKEEYKIMHALWARWIMLNRTQFIANYAKGVSDFVDYYWKFIYVASGWEGLRYWLLMLHANRFLTPSEVAETLNHYEKRTGMSDF